VEKNKKVRIVPHIHNLAEVQGIGNLIKITGEAVNKNRLPAGSVKSNLFVISGFLDLKVGKFIMGIITENKWLNG